MSFDSRKILVLQDLSLESRGRPLVTRLSLTLTRGKSVALMGGSGCGKSLTALALIGLLPPAIIQTSGTLSYEGKESPLHERSRLRGKEISIVFQNPMSALNPMLSIGQQFEDSLLTHLPLSKEAARKRAVEALDEVGLCPGASLARLYPHQLSGGMRQRALIALALTGQPKVLIADEITTALDMTTQRAILSLLRQIQERYEMAILFISHDPEAVGEIADSVCVMHQGTIVESGPLSTLFARPQHPYTQTLLRNFI